MHYRLESNRICFDSDVSETRAYNFRHKTDVYAAGYIAREACLWKASILFIHYFAHQHISLEPAPVLYSQHVNNS